MAKFFGCSRTALSGGNSKITRSDTLHPHLFIECKYGKNVAPWKLFLETEEKAHAEGKTPCLALKLSRQEGFLLCMRDRDLLKIATVYESAMWKSHDDTVDKFEPQGHN